MDGSRARRSIASERGVALMEVVVSAAVLLLVVLGVMAGLDAVAGTAGANKARTVAAVLAEKDQEELRSLKTADLNQLESLIPEPRTVMVDGVPYTIKSEAHLITDAGGKDISCALDDGEGSFVRITSTVTSPMTGAKVKPVTLSSIVAPEPGSGTLVARVRNAKDEPVMNMPVQATLADDPPAKTVRTNEAGCAVFGTMESGSYNLEVDQLGWVDPDGKQEVIKTATVASGTLTTVEFLYDLGATLTVNVKTTPAGTDTAQDAGTYGVIAGHNGISTNFRAFPQPAATAPASTWTLTGLFPFDEDEYKIYSGTCTAADPIADPRPADYFDLLDNPEGGPFDATPALTPGERRTITISEPAINLNATFSRDIQDSRVYASPTTAGCGPARLALGRVVSGKAERPGVPFGTYNVCVQFRGAWPDTDWYRLTVPVTVDRSPGTLPIDVAVTTSSPSTRGAC